MLIKGNADEKIPVVKIARIAMMLVVHEISFEKNTRAQARQRKSEKKSFCYILIRLKNVFSFLKAYLLFRIFSTIVVFYWFCYLPRLNDVYIGYTARRGADGWFMVC